MAKANRPTKTTPTGPFLDAAFICEEVVKEVDGTYSAIRMVNRIIFHEGTFSPGTAYYMPLTMVIGFKAGDTTGTQHLGLDVTNPSGTRTPFEGYVFPHPLNFAGEDTGALVVMHNFPIRYETDGTYWIDVMLDGKLYSRLPLTIRTKQP